MAERIRDEEGAYLPYQYYNQANPMAHYRTTGPEIWRQTDGTVTHWVAGVGTGGTISGVGRYLKEQNPAIRVIGVDPVGSVYRYYYEHRELPPPEQIKHYLIDGIGEDFMPETVWWDYIDERGDDRRQERLPRAFELARTEAICPARRAAGDRRRAPDRARARRREPGRHPDSRLRRALPVEAQPRVVERARPDLMRRCRFNSSATRPR